MKKHNEVSLKDAIKQMISAYRLSPGLREVTLRESWPKLMGPTIAGMTRRVDLDGTVLHIQVDSAPLRQELAFSKEKIRTLMNEALGEDFLKEVRVS